MGFEVVVSLWEAPWPVPHRWIHLTIKHVIYVRQFSGRPRTGRKHLEVQTESWVGWRPGGKKNVLEVEADKIKYMVMIKWRRIRKVGHVARMGETIGAHTVLVGKTEWKEPLARHRHRWEDNIKIDLREAGRGHGLD